MWTLSCQTRSQSWCIWCAAMKSWQPSTAVEMWALHWNLNLTFGTDFIISVAKAIHISWSNAVCVCGCLDVNQGGMHHITHTETCNPACTELLMNPDRMPKNQVSLTCFMGQNCLSKKWVWIGILKPAERHSPLGACYFVSGWCVQLKSKRSVIESHCLSFGIFGNLHACG